MGLPPGLGDDVLFCKRGIIHPLVPKKQNLNVHSGHACARWLVRCTYINGGSAYKLLLVVPLQVAHVGAGNSAGQISGYQDIHFLVPIINIDKEPQTQQHTSGLCSMTPPTLYINCVPTHVFL